MKAAELRQKFVEFFRSRGHEEVASSPLVPADDPTLLFTNAGMVQFKRTFLGQEPRAYKRAVTVQKCVRAGGKHNDLEQVGLTRRHHTFFEMLGNFSFGDYFKEDAIRFAWEFVTSKDYLGLHPDRLLATVHHSDTEARYLWHQVSGLPRGRVYGLGDADNFWQMGDTGPCGPCSEIFVDLEWRPGQKAPSLPQAEFEAQAEAGRFLEIWNLVFMQFDRSADGTLTPLPKPSVDTGAGLERIAAVMQGEDDNFHTDLFRPLLDRAGELVGRPYPGGLGGEGASFRVLADHARAVSFLLTDGVYPSNDGRGYVLRRILRRAVRHAWLLGRREPTLAPLTAVVVREMGRAYPDLAAKAEFLETTTANEEVRFLETIGEGLERLDEMFASGATRIGGEDAFKLYDTFGFPIDLTQLIAAERGATVDLKGFETALEDQRERSRAAIALGGQYTPRGDLKVRPGSAIDPAGLEIDVTHMNDRPQRFVGYTTTESETDVLAYKQIDGEFHLLLEQNPFYAESGGQVSDTGVVKGEGWELPVTRVTKTDDGTFVGGSLREFEPSPVHAQVDTPRRRNIERHHSATHLVHWALREVLGSHVRQQGSLVEPGRLRFDFSHHGPIEPETLATIERLVNELIWENDPVATEEMKYDAALALGAMAFFSEKYGDLVRVVQMGPSIELCGGTHVRTTGQLGLFRFSGQGGVASGVRRIEAIAGPEAYAEIGRLERELDAVAGTLKARREHVQRRLEQLLEERDKLEKRVSEMAASGAAGPMAEGQRLQVDGVTVVLGDTASEDRGEIGSLADQFRAGNAKGVLLLFSSSGRGAIHAAVTDDLVKAGKRAGDLVNLVAEVSGGKGGGRPVFASAGAGDVTRLDAARSAAPAIVERWLRDGE